MSIFLSVFLTISAPTVDVAMHHALASMHPGRSIAVEEAQRRTLTPPHPYPHTRYTSHMIGSPTHTHLHTQIHTDSAMLASISLAPPGVCGFSFPHRVRGLSQSKTACGLVRTCPRFTPCSCRRWTFCFPAHLTWLLRPHARNANVSDGNALRCLCFDA